MVKQTLRRLLSPLLVISVSLPMAGEATSAFGQGAQGPAGLVHKVTASSDRIEMTVNTSRRLTLDQEIPEAQVNNPEIVELTPLSPNTVQILAKSPGVTQVNLWSEDGTIYTIDVIVYADAQELDMMLKAQFPKAALKVIPVATGVLISGYIDDPTQAELVIRIAEEYYPKVLNNMTVSGVQQILLQVKIIEVSRTKLRSLGFDFASIAAAGTFISTAGNILVGAEQIVFSNDSGFTGVLEALREDKLAKIMAEPNIVAISGRPSFFNVGGEIGYVKSTSTDGTVSVAFKEFGTRVDFVAIVLGNGRIRLEVRPRVSEVDRANSVDGIPALKTRTVDTGVELQAGQTLAIAGLVQQRIEAENHGLPWVSEVPYVGALFRRVEHRNNEVELLVLVTPELVDAMSASEVPQCGPGMRTASPNDGELFMGGHLEVPNCCLTCDGSGCPNCKQVGVSPEGIVVREFSQVGPSAPGRGSDAYNRGNPTRPDDSRSASRSGRQNAATGFIGPIGYDVVR